MRTVLVNSHLHRAQVERLEVVETGWRLRWSEEEKLKIVPESLQAPRQISATARTIRPLALAAASMATVVSS